MSLPLIELVGVGKDFSSSLETVRVLSDVSMAIKSGETFAITGPSGSGKSTLLAILAGLERPSIGRIQRDGIDTTNWDEEALARWRKQRVGFVFQSFRLIPTLTALENASFPLELLGESPLSAEKRARELLDILGLGHRFSHRPSELSGGEQQRVAIARAYVHRPALILADEPTGSLDRNTASKVLDALLEANQKMGSGLIIVTHDEIVAQRMKRHLKLDNGVLQA
jgi:putative ABC transport system ATP-binding protein